MDQQCNGGDSLPQSQDDTQPSELDQAVIDHNQPKGNNEFSGARPKTYTNKAFESDSGAIAMRPAPMRRRNPLEYTLESSENIVSEDFEIYPLVAAGIVDVMNKRKSREPVVAPGAQVIEQGGEEVEMTIMYTLRNCLRSVVKTCQVEQNDASDTPAVEDPLSPRWQSAVEAGIGTGGLVAAACTGYNLLPELHRTKLALTRWLAMRVWDDYCMEVTAETESEFRHQMDSCQNESCHERHKTLDNVTLEDFPQCYQMEKFLKFIRLVSNTVALVIVQKVSSTRPETDPLFNQRGLSFLRAGTGIILNFHQVYKDGINGTCPCLECKTSKKPQNTWAAIQLSTIRSLVFDKVEAESVIAKIQFENKREARLYGLVMFSDAVGGDSVIVTCCTHDEYAIRRLYILLPNLELIYTGLHRKFKLAPNLMVMFSWLHGCEKRIGITENLYQKALPMHENKELTDYWYTIPVCRGCSGAPLLIFGIRVSLEKKMHHHLKVLSNDIAQSGSACELHDEGMTKLFRLNTKILNRLKQELAAEQELRTQQELAAKRKQVTRQVLVEEQDLEEEHNHDVVKPQLNMAYIQNKAVTDAQLYDYGDYLVVMPTIHRPLARINTFDHLNMVKELPQRQDCDAGVSDTPGETEIYDILTEYRPGKWSVDQPDADERLFGKYLPKKRSQINLGSDNYMSMEAIRQVLQISETRDRPPSHQGSEEKHIELQTMNEPAREPATSADTNRYRSKSDPVVIRLERPDLLNSSEDSEEREQGNSDYISLSKVLDMLYARGSSREKHAADIISLVDSFSRDSSSTKEPIHLYISKKLIKKYFDIKAKHGWSSEQLLNLITNDAKVIDEGNDQDSAIGSQKERDQNDTTETQIEQVSHTNPGVPIAGREDK